MNTVRDGLKLDLIAVDIVVIGDASMEFTNSTTQLSDFKRRRT